MFGKGMSRLLALMVIPAAWQVTTALAAKPWENLFSANTVEANPNKTYDLSEENGPWMIMACSFSGPGAEQQAKDLVLELRKKNLPAYFYKKRFEFGKIEGRGVDRFNQPLKLKYQRGLDQVDEIAVLVGNYRAVDEPEAQEVLQKVKTIDPDCLKPKDGKASNVTRAGWGAVQQFLPGTGRKKLGLLGHAFMTTNPLLPKDYFVPKGVDKQVVLMNEGLEYCLLNCSGKYTVRVAHFTGAAVIDQNEIREINAGHKQMATRLADAAEKAHLLTVALRKAGFEAYEFHDLEASIVTVGSFQSIGTHREDGKIELSSDVYRIIERFGSDAPATAVPAVGPSAPLKGKAWKIEGGMSVPFDVTPLPIEVPRRSIAADYRRDILSRK